MGDLSAEPSMEDILSSIKRIISEEGDGAAKPRARKANVRPVPSPPEADAEDEVLELSDPMPDPVVRATAIPAAETLAQFDTSAQSDKIVSGRTANAARDALDTLSKLMIKPDPAGDGTLEGLVREMLRPMLREWIDAHLPGIVESMVAREIARITREGR